MHIPEEAPPLKPWPFLAGDAILVATAIIIANQAQAPLSATASLAIAGCVSLGASLALIPFVLNHTHRQDLALADRQREISALAQSTAASAEQLSIAAASLHTIAESAARATKLAEQIPHKVQDKINDFKTQLNEVAVTENESLAQEINTLRASETERLEAALTGVRKAATELGQVETATRKHLAELNDSLIRFAASAQKSAAESARIIDEARANAEKSLAAAQASAANTIKDSATTALGEIERKLAALAGKTAELPASAKPVAVPTPARPATAASFETTATPAPTFSTPPFSPPPPAEKPAHRPSADAKATTEPLDSAKAEPAAEDVATAVMDEEKPLRKRAQRKPAASDNDLTLGLELPSLDREFSQIEPDDATPAVSADGLTRLLVTAYIGIGNKLYVRGEGPGLSMDRGIPLQFVSIGKWRWESADATAPVTLKLYKNDEHECPSLGAVTLQPGHQQEVTASFHT
ncbi:MAG: hypothetical protein IPP19_05085 [Verrucomicrobia bacterium]|nr:hypothetical protein [Verrucomicrobiota bacterium]